MIARAGGALLTARDGLRARLRRALRGGDFAPETAIPPIAKGARDGLGMAIIVKDEADYIREWLEFHLMLGARRVYVYDNGSTDGTVAALAPYVARGVVRVTPWRAFCGLGVQPLAYAHAIANFGPDHRWMAFIDVDEFLVPQSADSLPEALATLAHLPSVSIPWRNFGPNGHETRPEGLVIENYTECAPLPPPPEQRALLRFKSVIDPERAAASAAHLFPLRELGAVAFNQRGERTPFHALRDPAFAAEGPLQLNHYFTRSRDEMRAREAKGRVGRNGGLNPGYADRRLRQYALATTRDTTILRFAPALKARLEGSGAVGSLA